jgi:hypothetical protein
MLVITSFKDMLIDQLKKQMSDGNSTCPLDPIDTRKSNGQLEIHLTNGMSNGLLIFPSDILHRYWTLITVLSDTSVFLWRFDWLGNSSGRSFQPTDERVSTGHMPAMEACKISDGGQLNSGITKQFLD